MSTYTIGEAADRSGFSASALRYYDGLGLVQPAARTEAGYRIYDDHALGRLAFIARAKQLGCSLEEITDLVAIWDGQRCGPVQRRFHELVTGKIGDAQRHIVELAAFVAQLQMAAERLSREPADGPCGDGCACADPAPPPMNGAIACTLEPDAMTDRLADWNVVLGRATAHRSTVDGGVRVELGDDVELGDLARLVAAEQRCCSFFAFALTVDHRGIALEVHAPEAAADLVAGLLGVTVP